MNYPHAGHESAWNASAQEYAVKAERFEPILRPVTQALLDAVGAMHGTRLLDLGCGPGHTTAAARARGAEALGVDLSPAMVSLARQRFPDALFAVGDMATPPPGPWDAITSRFAAHHAGAAWLHAAYRVLCAGGRIAIAEVVREPDDDDSTGKVDPDEWRRRFETAGFVGVEVKAMTLDDPIASHLHDDQKRPWPSTWIVAGRKPEVDA